MVGRIGIYFVVTLLRYVLMIVGMGYGNGLVSPPKLGERVDRRAGGDGFVDH